MESVGLKSKLSNAIYYIASFFMPSILLFDLYNRNHVQNHIVFVHVLILAGAVAIAGLLLFMALKRIVKSVEGALILALLFWVMFWLYESLLGGVRGILSFVFFPSRVFILILLVVFIGVMIAFRQVQPPFDKIRPAFNVLAFILIVLFVFNLFPGASSEIAFVRERARLSQLDDSEMPFYIKRNFQIDLSLPSPNIHWFHMDNLMSIETVEQFWGLNYDCYREELETRGFIINEGATLNAGSTALAHLALLSPAFYDSFLAEQLASRESESNIEGVRISSLHDEFVRVGLTPRSEELEHYRELFNAFFARGYELMIHSPFEENPTSFEHLIGDEQFVTGRKLWDDFRGSALPRLLALTTPLPMLSSYEVENHGDEVRHLTGVEPVAKLFFYPIYDAHMEISVRDRVVEPLDDIPNEFRYDLYPSLGFESAIVRVLRYVDDILESNPYAVIVLQADHGFHLIELQEFLLEQGYSEEEIVELMHSVFSAVRIPEEFGGLEEPIAPLNITRELINRFIGENYDLLP